MKYFIDTEFIEGFHKPLFGKKRHFIDLISIAIVREDGSSFSAISSEYNYEDADDWVKQNVILPLYMEVVHGDNRNHYSVHNFQRYYGRTNNEIASDIVNFVNTEKISEGGQIVLGKFFPNVPAEPDFYAYYADYDWVVFCSLFGRMIDLPKGFPMYCKDLKQYLDDYADKYQDRFMNGDESQETKLGWIKNKDDYPKQENEHSALDDARWNKKLYEFLKSKL